VKRPGFLEQAHFDADGMWYAAAEPLQDLCPSDDGAGRDRPLATATPQHLSLTLDKHPAGKRS
jgi:hypothetical protein